MWWELVSAPDVDKPLAIGLFDTGSPNSQKGLGRPTNILLRGEDAGTYVRTEHDDLPEHVLIGIAKLALGVTSE